MARLAFLGSPEPAAVALAALADAGHDITVVVTEPDRRRGRGSTLMPTPVKRLAESRGIAVSAEVEAAATSGAEVGVVVAFGRLIRPDVLDRLEMVNAHFSLLPRWRGAAPVERAILAGDSLTGVSLMKLEQGLDTGPVYEEVALPILPHESAASLTDRLSGVAAGLLLRRLAYGRDSLGDPVPQHGDATYAAKISPSELRIDWTAPAERIERLVRIGRAFTVFRGRRLIVWEAIADADSGAKGDDSARADRAVPGDSAPAGGTATSSALASSGAPAPGSLVGGRVATGDGWLELLVVQPEGRPRLDAKQWWRGARITEADSFTSGSG